MAQKKLLKRIWRRMIPVVIPPVGEAFIRALFFTMGKDVKGVGAMKAEMDAGQGIIIAFWHGKMVLMPAFFERYVQREGYALISQHRDGELITRTIMGFNLDSIRGSSRRGGRDAMEEMIELVRAGAVIGITPDGPLGPREIARKGAIKLAHITGAPIFPASFAASRQKKLDSWDRFTIPAPFSKVVFVIGEPIRVKGDEGIEGREELRVEFERRLIEAGLEAERLVGWKEK